MPTTSKTAQKVIDDTALAYVTNSSVVSTDPQYIGGQNCMTSLRQWLERRPGFGAKMESIATAFTNLQRQFVWHRWAGSATNPDAFIWMGCDISAGVAKVYKMVLGVDASASLIWTSTSNEPFDFVVSNNTCFFGNGTDMKAFDGVTLRNWGIVAPAVAPTLTLVAGTATVTVSWCYVVTYTNETIGHESSPSPLTACSGPFGPQAVQLGLTASTDPQVTNIRVYRTSDGGAQTPLQMREIPGSPFPNVTGNITDQAPDVSPGVGTPGLSTTRIAPAFLRNDPPPPSKGFVWAQSRIWSFANNITYYSGFEEINPDAIPEESWPSGVDGNNFPWDKQVNAHAALLDGIAVYVNNTIYKIEGDSLDTFRRYALLQKRGCRARTAVASLGGSVTWFDTSRTWWVSDIGEIGKDIRPDLKTVNPKTAEVVIHIDGLSHWILLNDPPNKVVYVYDLDRQRIMPPWRYAKTLSAMGSYETADGVSDLMVAYGGITAVKLTPDNYNDHGDLYGASVTTNMYRLTPDSAPEWKGAFDNIELKTDTQIASDVTQLVDDDPSLTPFTSIGATAIPSPDIIQGKNLLTTRYSSSYPQGQYLALQIFWPAVDQNFHLFQTCVALHPVGE